MTIVEDVITTGGAVADAAAMLRGEAAGLLGVVMLGDDHLVVTDACGGGLLDVLRSASW